MTAASVIVTLALFALVRLTGPSRHPRPVVVQRQTLFAIGTPRIMLALALTVDHACLVGIILHTIHWYATTGVTVAQAAASNDHLIQ
jgi:hypothetical protein